jgi:hypothetical protein
MAVAVVCSHTDDCDAWPDRGEELVGIESGAMMGNLEHIGSKICAARQQIRLRVKLHIPGEQQPTGGGGRPEHH